MAHHGTLYGAFMALVAAICLIAWTWTPVAAQEAQEVDAGQAEGGGATPTAEELVEAAHEYWRGQSSISIMEMTIHRPDWERTMVLKVWTKGQDDSLFRVLEPARDKDNATLKKGRDMWSYNPRVNRVISIPPSMMAQAWMGSDFSNDDLSKTDSVLVDYEHTLISGQEQDGVTVYVIDVPRPSPWRPWCGASSILTVREDFILLQARSSSTRTANWSRYMTGEDIQDAGRQAPALACGACKRPTSRTNTPSWSTARWTFDADVPDNMFTQEALRNPRR